MELDKRIKTLSDILTCFDLEQAEQFIGQKGYFADIISSYQNLGNRAYGTLTHVKDGDYPFKEGKNSHWRFFIPESKLKPVEKKYRAYTIDEFLEKFHLGDSIVLRAKNHINMQFNVVYNGYKIIDNNKIEFYFGPVIFTLPELFQSYERFYNGRWFPFGVEE